MSKRLGRLVRERRQEQELTQTALAVKLGVTKSYLSMVETGRRVPADDQFDAFAGVLEMPADMLRVAAGRLPPDVATAVPDKAETIVSAIRRDDEGARITFPRELSPPFECIVVEAAKRDGPPNDLPPYSEELRAGKNSQAYRAHSYHTKVPPEVIQKLIRHYTSEGQLVVDPFSGSGMTGVASILTGRNAVLSDLSPAAVHISRNYTTPCDPRSLAKAANEVLERVRPTLSWLYETGAPASRARVEYTVWSDVFQCPKCGTAIVYWEGARDPGTGAINPVVKCSSCGHLGEKRDLRWIGERPVETNAKGPRLRDAHPPTNGELELIERANEAEILHWIPQVPFTAAREMWRAAHTSQGITSVADFYTKRNLHAMGAIRHAIQEERDERLRAALFFAFTGMANRASKRYQWNVKRPTNVMTGTLYISSLRYEWNVGSLFERKLRDAIRYYEHLGTPNGRAEAVQASATSLEHLPDRSADYVFMDPPFGANIFYADSSLLWDAWLGTLTDEGAEIVVNKHRSAGEGGKSLPDYQRLMTDAFREVCRVLKPSACATLQFNNSSDDVWCAIQDSVSDAGLEVRHAVGLDKIHPSIKGVKGRQAREDVASLDALIELRRRPSSRLAAKQQSVSEQRLRTVLLEFGGGRRSPFTTDEAFAFLVRDSLTAGHSISGVSLQSVKMLCSSLFKSAGTMWASTHTGISTAATPQFDPVESPFGCVVERCLTSDDVVLSLLDLTRPAPDCGGDAPRVVVGQRNTAFYNAHSYHTKVPPEAIVPFVRHFTRPGDVVLDPFCGTGMTGVAAQLTGRRAVLSDLSVAAAHLAYNHTRPCSVTDLERTFDEIAQDLEKEFRALYACADGGSKGYLLYTLWSRDAICPSCKSHFSMWDAIDRETGRMPKELACPKCKRVTSKHGLKYAGNRPVLLSYERANGKRRQRKATPEDLVLFRRKARAGSDAWFPEVPVDAAREMYIRSALHLQGIETVADFYTPRNLRALARLWERIQIVGDERVRAALTFAFTNTTLFRSCGGQRESSPLGQ